MEKNRILGVDFGDRRTGLALSDPSGMLAGGIGVITAYDIESCAKAIMAAAEEHGVCAIVVGKPLNMNGSIGPRAQKAEELIACLRTLTDLPIIPQDERLTTVAAHQYLRAGNVKSKKRKAVVDALSAQIILQNYLDGRHNNSAGSAASIKQNQETPIQNMANQKTEGA